MSLAVSLLLLAVAVSPGAAAGDDPGFAWSSEAVEIGVQPTGSMAIALDSQERPRIAYVNSRTGTVRFAQWTGTDWYVEGIPQVFSARGLVSLALGSDDAPHLTFYDAQARAIRYAHRGSGGWSVRLVDASHLAGHSSLALDSLGAPHVAYASTNAALRYARPDGDAWFAETVDAEVIGARFPSLALDDADRPHIAYYGDGLVKYARWTGFRWTLEVADPTERVESVTLRLDASGRPRIGYREVFQTDLRYTEWTGAVWVTEVVDGAGDAGWDARLTLDAQGDPHFAYYHRDVGILKYARRTSGGWSLHVVDHHSVTGWYAAIAIGSDFRPHIAYFSWTDRSTMYAQGNVAPGVRTWPVRSVTATSATIVTEVTSLGPSASANASFEWREPEGVWRRGTTQAIAERGVVTFSLGDLAPGTLYEARAVLEANGTTLYGEGVAFVTLTVPPPGRVDPTVIGAGFLATAIVLASAIGFLLWREKRREREDGMRDSARSTRRPDQG